MTVYVTLEDLDGETEAVGEGWFDRLMQRAVENRERAWTAAVLDAMQNPPTGTLWTGNPPCRPRRREPGFDLLPGRPAKSPVRY